MGSKADFPKILGHVEKGALKPVLDRVFPLSEIAEAHRYLEARGPIGKVGLRI
jgi:NADPH:quinone reductase-like Zn-dependent oxidoreductase